MKTRGIFFITVLLFVGIISLYFPISKLYSADDSKINQTIDDTESFNKTTQALHLGWEYVRLGDSYKRQGNYGEAIEAYEKAYKVDAGNRVFTGDILIKAYASIKKYDKAIAVVDEILKTQHLSNKGRKDFSDIREQLIVKKSQTYPYRIPPTEPTEPPTEPDPKGTG